jgi:hypothetical protein
MIPAITRGAEGSIRSTIVQTVCCLARVTALVCAAASTAQGQAASPVTESDDPFVRRGWHLELGGHGALETWNYNISHEELFGFRAGLTYGLGRGVTLMAGWPLYYIDQRGVDGYLLGATVGVRGRIYRRGRASVFLGFEVGTSEADTSVPPRGTRFNYLALGGAGVTIRLRQGLHLLTGMKWIHVSNNGLAGRHRNPDIEAVGPDAALLIRF